MLQDMTLRHFPEETLRNTQHLGNIGHMPARKSAVDAAWLDEACRRSALGSRRQVALRIVNRRGRTLGEPAMARIVSGERTLSLDEARQLAELLEVPLAEAMQRMGLSEDPDELVLSRRALRRAIRDAAREAGVQDPAALARDVERRL